MGEYLYTVDVNDLQTLEGKTKQQAMSSLESGKIVYFPTYFFSPNADEEPLLSESILDTKHKNISYDYSCHRLTGLMKNKLPSALSITMQRFMHRFADFSKLLIDNVLPQYSHHLRWGRTSYRPAEIRGRKYSKRKDDTRLHVDSFPSTPVNGLRIFRVFCNVNPYGEPRVWHVGEPFSQVMAKFSPQISSYSPTRAKMLNLIKVTKTLRSPYDHYMLNLHDKMKLDDNYQQTVNKSRIEFPAQSSWLVFTDHVSHAALSGQFVLEQTFYLPVTAMTNPSLSPLKQWNEARITG